MVDIKTEVDAVLAEFCILTSSKDEQLLMRPFLSKTKKYEHGGRLNVKIHILFCGDSS
jgi:hypothetical protein